jgi:Carboxypeptidase regulatory-like domain
MLRPAALALLVLLAGCSGGGTGGDGGEGDGSTSAAPIAQGNGRLCAVVVDDAIRPIANANVTVKLTDGTTRSVLSGEDGRACLDLPPGTYILQVESVTRTYKAAQTSGEVEAGEESTVKVLLERLFTQEPYHETLKFDGFIQCGYDVTAASSICVNDYTHFVGPTTCPECEHLVDRRGTEYAVGPGWQTQVYEMVWKTSAQGTSDQMRITVSFYPRVASHWYCSAFGPTPVYMRMDLNVTCENQQDEPELVPPEGLPNMYLFAATKAPEGQFVSATFSQSFQVFMNNFYYGAPPDGWSFVNGDPYPF